MVFYRLKAIGHRFKAARERAGLTQDALAEKDELSTTHISCIERGVKPPALDTFVILANAIGASTDILLQDVLTPAKRTEAEEIMTDLNSLFNEDQERVRIIIRAFALTRNNVYTDSLHDSLRW